jgi:hypothetical protein
MASTRIRRVRIIAPRSKEHTVPYAVAVFVFVAILGVAGQPAPARPSFTTVIPLESTAEDSANVSMGDLDGDGDLDLVLAKGRHTPIVDRVLLNDGKGGFVASDLGPGDRTYTAALADLDGDGDLDVLTCEERHAGRGLGVVWYENPARR